ncbi:MAG: hypothetical protein ACR2L1_01520 [Pyrinomonadaceae bacterium]
MIFISADAVFSQSSSPEFPTAVSTNEITGSIPARDLGDARLTTFYYTFNGTQGDIFINISASNFTGDVDVFSAEGLRPISKISFYGDAALTETGRVIYLRKPDKLILRVQGRTPDDNAATFRIKFAGSFLAVEDNGENKQLALPTVNTEETSGIRVNSVGTIIKTTPTPESKKTIAETKTDEETKIEKAETTEEIVSENAAKVIVTNELGDKKSEDEAKETAETPKKTPAKTKPAARNTRRGARRNTAAKTPAKSKTAENAEKTENAETSKTANPLENVRLVVLLKNGDKMEFPMPEVFRFSLNNGILTIITKDGKIQRTPIVDVQKMTIE